MSLPRAFLSFDFDHDLAAKNLFAGQAKTDSPTPFAVQDWSSKSPLPQAEWEKLIKEKIGKCDMLIVLVGTHMSTATGVVKEIKMAADLGVPTFGVYVNGAGTSSTLPAGLPRTAVVSWDWKKISDMIQKCIKAGKSRFLAGLR